MDQLLQELNPLWVVVLCCGLCVGGIFLTVVLPVIGGALDIFFGVFEFFFDLLSGGPVAWCGCLFFLGACCGCSVLTYTIINLLSTCGTPDAVNFCRLF